MSSLLLGWFGTTEVIIIVLVLVLLFGGKKIPEMMRGIGKGIREFKSGVSGKDDNPTDNKEA